MKCSYCGTPVEEGRLFCLNCGEEIEWVPEYNAIGSYRPNSVTAELEPLTSEEEEKQRLEQPTEGGKKKRSPLRIGGILFIICICGLLGCKYYIDQKNYNSFSYQSNMAETEYSNREYDLAYEYIERALSLEPDREDAMLLKANILLAQENTQEALELLQSVVERFPDHQTAYGQMIRIYEADGETDKIKELLSTVKDESVLEKYKGYITEKPVISLPSGDYDEIPKVELYSPDDADYEIYYTTNGAMPTKDSKRYFNSITLEEGTTHLKAIAISEKGITSEMAQATYKVTLLPPEPPRISPASGTFTPEMETKIYIVVPDDCTAYYAYDEEPTIESTKYMDPIDMPEGHHIFYAILVDENGKQSEASSAEFTLTPNENS